MALEPKTKNVNIIGAVIIGIIVNVYFYRAG